MSVQLTRSGCRAKMHKRDVSVPFTKLICTGTGLLGHGSLDSTQPPAKRRDILNAYSIHVNTCEGHHKHDLNSLPPSPISPISSFSYSSATSVPPVRPPLPLSLHDSIISSRCITINYQHHHSYHHLHQTPQSHHYHKRRHHPVSSKSPSSSTQHSGRPEHRIKKSLTR